MATKEQVFQFAREEAARQGLPPDLIENMVRQESQGNINAKSRKGARGPMQLMPATAKDLGVDINNWQDNIRGGVKYMGQMLNRFNDPALAVAAYNAGPTAVARAGGIPQFKETQDYVQKVLGTNMARRTVSEEELGLAPTGRATPAVAGGRNVVSVEDLAPATPATPATPQAQPSQVNLPALGREAGRQIGLRGRDVLVGAGQVLDIGGAPVANLMRMGGIPAQTPSQSLSRFADFIGLPRPQGKLEESISNVARAAVGVVPTVAAGRIISSGAGLLPQMTGAQAVGRGLAQGPGVQTAAVGSGTAASEVARQNLGVENPFALGAINLATAVPTAAVASRMGNVRTGQQYADQAAGQLIESARGRGVGLTAADVQGGSATLRSLRGAAGTAEQVANTRTQEIERLINRTAEDLKPASVKTGNEARVIAQDMRNQYRAAKAAVSPKFDRAQDLAGQQKITLNNTANASNAVAEAFPVTAETALLKRNLDRLETFVKEGGGTYKEIRDLQKNIGAEMNRVSKGVATGAFNEMQVGALSRLYNSLDDDVMQWAAPRVVNGKQVFTPAGAAHAQAMDQFRQTVAPFRQDPDIYRLVSSRTTGVDYDRAAETFNNKLTNNVETADLAMNLMSEKGQKAAQYSVVNDARLSGLKIDPTNPSVPGFVGRLNLGIPDNPTPQRVILSKTPGLLDELSTVRDIANTAATGMVTQADTMLPFAGRGAGAVTTGLGSLAAGVDPATAAGIGLAAGAVIPQVAGGAANLLSGPAATRFLMGQTTPSTGLTMSAAQQQATPLAEMPPEQSLRPGYNLLDFIGQTFNNE